MSRELLTVWTVTEPEQAVLCEIVVTLPTPRKLGVADRTQAVKRGRELGIH
jgi:hypothetical protein